VDVLPTTLSIATGAKNVIVTRLAVGGRVITQGATYVSSDPTKATVTENGVIRGIAAGTSTITVSHPSATGTDTCVVTVT
jgi:uncharacterized protein YjdB